MKELVLYIHGKGGCAGESEHYKPLFPDRAVVGLEHWFHTDGQMRFLDNWILEGRSIR